MIVGETKLRNLKIEASAPLLGLLREMNTPRPQTVRDLEGLRAVGGGGHAWFVAKTVRVSVSTCSRSLSTIHAHMRAWLVDSEREQVFTNKRTMFTANLNTSCV